MLWFRLLVERPEAAHLEPEHRDAVAAEVALEVAHRWPWRLARVLFWGYWICMLPLLAAGPHVAIAWGFHPWEWACAFFAYASGFVLTLWSLRIASRRFALRRLRELLVYEAADPASSPRHQWAPVARDLRRELERLRADMWAHSRAAAWRPRVFAAPEGAAVPPLLRNELALEACERAARDPIVRTYWRLASVFPLFVLLAGIILLVGLARQSVGVLDLLGPWPFVLAIAPALLLAAEVRGRRQARRVFRELLLAAGQRPARCFVCRSDLASVTGSRCPACGAVIGREE